MIILVILNNIKKKINFIFILYIFKYAILIKIKSDVKFVCFFADKII